MALQKASTSASADDREPEDCFFDDQSTGPFVKNVKPDWLFLVVLSAAQSESA